jgi:membrane-bound ClpP family serine protease
MIAWVEVPWSLWAYVILATAGIVVAVFSTPVAPSVFAVIFVLAWDLLLLRGIRWVWLGTLILGVLNILVDAAAGTGTWHGYGLVGLALLLLPPTRHFFERADPLMIV